MAKIIVAAILLISVLLSGRPAASQEKGIADFPKLNGERDWPWWRGPQRNGHALPADVPVKLDETKNLLWKARVPGRGHASPTIVGSKVFLSTSNPEKQIHSVVAFDLQTGIQVWSLDLNQGGFPEKNHPKNTEATATIACDGEQLFIVYYHHDGVHLTSISLDGKEQWTKRIDRFRPKMFEYGYAPSPLIYRNSVIVAFEYDGPSALVAYSRTTGEQLWKASRVESISFSSPVIATFNGADQLLISGQASTSAYDPSNGKQLWSTPGPALTTCGTAVWENNLVFVSGGYPESQTFAVDATKKGKVVWRNREKCYEESMLAVGGYLYAFTGKGILFCWRSSDGKEMWKQRLAGPVSASPVLVNDRIYWANEAGVLYVVKATSEKFELLAENRIGDSSFASPAISGDKILLRVAQQDSGVRQEYLYAFGNNK